MPELRGSFLDSQCDLILGEFTFSDSELGYLRSVDEGEAIRTLADMGAASVLIEGKQFTEMEKLIGRSETLPLKLDNGEIIRSPGSCVVWGIEAAQQLRQSSKWKARQIRKVMAKVGLTAQTVRN